MNMIANNPSSPDIRRDPAVGRVSAKRVTRQSGDRIVGLRLRLTRPTSCLPDEPQSNRPRSQERQHLR